MNLLAGVRASMVLACLLLTVNRLAALEANVPVRVSVNIVPSSGACAVVSAIRAVAVACGRGSPDPAPMGPVLPTVGDAGARYQYVGALSNIVALDEAVGVYSKGVTISGWRTVSLDNRSYVELTLAW